MFCLAYASVPLYRVFCQVTGYGGTTQRAVSAPLKIGKQIITVHFDSNIAPGLSWKFGHPQPVSVHTGENKLIAYTAENTSHESQTGVATFNVTPERAGVYFNKIHCFCFENQTLQPGEKVNMPVSFFVDPDIANDPDLQGLAAITLSYTFFKAAK
jgi:cytochrome c oxidase assembly protein subunit 11